MQVVEILQLALIVAGLWWLLNWHPRFTRRPFLSHDDESGRTERSTPDREHDNDK
jgi:hypothetical protein